MRADGPQFGDIDSGREGRTKSGSLEPRRSANRVVDEPNIRC